MYIKFRSDSLRYKIRCAQLPSILNLLKKIKVILCLDILLFFRKYAVDSIIELTFESYRLLLGTE